MSLYDDDDVVTADPGWGTAGGLLPTAALQSNTALDGSLQSPSTVSRPSISSSIVPKPKMSSSSISSSSSSSAPVSLPPVINLGKNKNVSGQENNKGQQKYNSGFGGGDAGLFIRGEKSLLTLKDPNWQPVNEYDPLWPNDYHKVVKEMRNAKRREREANNKDGEDPFDGKKRRYTEAGKERARERFQHGDQQGSASKSGFGRRPRMDGDYSDEDDEGERERERPERSRDRKGGSSGGAAIAPPPSLTASSGGGSDSPPPPSNISPAMAGAGLGVAAKIMAKYGYKVRHHFLNLIKVLFSDAFLHYPQQQGQGLGRDEQGMSQALSVEKTSKRGGRIVHEKDLMPPPAFGLVNPETSMTPPHMATTATDEYGNDPGAEEDSTASGKPSITDLMKNPSKVVMCKVNFRFSSHHSAYLQKRLHSP